MAEIIDGKPSMRKFWVPPVCAVVILGVLAYFGYRAYAHWEPEYLVGKARRSVEKKDYLAAELQLQRALQINGGSVSALRLAAEMMEAAGEAEAVQWRAHVHELAPNSMEDKLAWLRAAIRFNRQAAIEKAVSSFTAGEKKTASFESCAGALAASHGNYEEATKHYLEAMRLDPNDGSIQFDYANALLNSRDLDVRRTGIEAMKKLSLDSHFSTSARRALIRTLAGNGDLEDALAESQPFQNSAGAAFEDRLMHLDILDRLARPEAPAYLAALQPEARKTPAAAGALIGWMNGRGKTQQAIEWARTLPKTFAGVPQCSASLADCYLAARDWANLENLTNGKKWNEFEFLRLVLLARAQRENGEDDNFKYSWQSAMAAAAGNWSRLDQLRQVVSAWGPGWSSQLNEVLLVLGKRWEDPKALQLLYVGYTKARDTVNLCEITGEMVKADPSNRNAANNYALLLMLLRRNLPDALKIAGGLYEADHANPVYVSTYAYGLHLSGFSAQGLKIMESLDTDQLSEPAIAAYYGILLAANNKPGKATEFLRVAQKEGDPLPEERKLVETAFNRSDLKLMPRRNSRESGAAD